MSLRQVHFASVDLELHARFTPRQVRPRAHCLRWQPASCMQPACNLEWRLLQGVLHARLRHGQAGRASPRLACACCPMRCSHAACSVPCRNRGRACLTATRRWPSAPPSCRRCRRTASSAASHTSSREGTARGEQGLARAGAPGLHLSCADARGCGRAGAGAAAARTNHACAHLSPLFAATTLISGQRC